MSSRLSHRAPSGTIAAQVSARSIRGWLQAFLLTMALSRYGVAQTAPTLSGSWTASPVRTAWNIGNWPAECGARPGIAGAGGGAVNIQEKGRDLWMSGLGRSYTTNECWEQMPGLRTVTRSASAHNWRIVCKTPIDDPRAATVTTTITATDSRISFDETGQFKFAIRGQNCTASVRHTRVFDLQRRLETKPEASPSASAAASANPCAEPGPPTRLDVRPSRKLMRAGEEFTFRTLVADQRGCLVPAQVTWRVLRGGSAIELGAQGKVRVLDQPQEEEAELSASVGARSAKVLIQIASRERYEAMLKQRGFNEHGESEEKTVETPRASGSIGARSTVTQDRGWRGRWILAIALAGVVLALGVAGFVFARRALLVGGPTLRRPRIMPRPEPHPNAAGPPPKPVRKICPVCGALYPGDTQYCGMDGAVLVPVN
jgi:hypothetical protein